MSMNFKIHKSELERFNTGISEMYDKLESIKSGLNVIKDTLNKTAPDEVDMIYVNTEENPQFYEDLMNVINETSSIRMFFDTFDLTPRSTVVCFNDLDNIARNKVLGKIFEVIDEGVRKYNNTFINELKNYGFIVAFVFDVVEVADLTLLKLHLYSNYSSMFEKNITLKSDIKDEEKLKEEIKPYVLENIKQSYKAYKSEINTLNIEDIFIHSNNPLFQKLFKISELRKYIES